MFQFFNQKSVNPLPDFSGIGTDIHSHLLPGIDDGSPDMATSLLLINALRDLGFTRLYTTPHVMPGFYPNTRDIILKKRDEVLQAIENEAVGIETFDAAAEYYIDETFVELMKKEPLLTLPGNRVLVEMSFHRPYPDVHRVLFDLQMKGYLPILAHPERYPYYQTVEDYEQLKAMGCKLQVNLLSLVGYYGRPIQASAKKMLDNHLIDLLATDLHHERHAINLRDALSHKYILTAMARVQSSKIASKHPIGHEHIKMASPYGLKKETTVSQVTNMLKKILLVVGARPNFIKAAPLYRAFHHYPHFIVKLVHTGQHYDEQMSAVFFDQLELPNPDHYLGIGSGSHTVQTANTMLAFESVVTMEQPDLVMVLGDVNATLACALTSAKMGVPIAHVESGLRSGDRRMPEEINRILTDAISDYLFVTEPSGLDHLKKEGIASEKVFFTGNCMMDSLVFYQSKIAMMNTHERYGLPAKSYFLMTMHRPSNVDAKGGLETIFRMIELLAQHIPVVFPIHPRTKQQMASLGLFTRLNNIKNVYLLDPQGYLEFQHLLSHALAVLTDSGGVQEESTFWNVPCVTFRENTERPSTVDFGTNELLSELNPDLACAKMLQVLNGTWKQSILPELWDGKAAERIAAVIDQKF